MTKVRLFLKTKFNFSQKLDVDMETEHYLSRVMRKKDGDEIYIFNEEEEWRAKLSCKKKIKIIPLDLVKKKIPSDDVWICFSLIKSRNINYLVEKITEIGVKKIVPIITEYSERFNLNHNRLKKVIVEAVEQSDAIHIPELMETISLEELLNNFDKDRLIIFCDETKKGVSIFDVPPIKTRKIAILIGPVGGWSEKDKSFMKKKSLLNVNLGENILKADTAAIVSLSIIKGLML